MQIQILSKPVMKVLASSRVSEVKYDKDVFLATNAISDTWRQKESPTKRSNICVAKGSVAILKEYTQLCCVSQDSNPRKSILREP